MKTNLETIKRYFEFNDIDFSITIRENEYIIDVNATVDNFIFILESNKGNRTMMPYYNTLLAIYNECKIIKP